MERYIREMSFYTRCSANDGVVLPVVNALHVSGLVDGNATPALRYEFISHDSDWVPFLFCFNVHTLSDSC